MESNTNNPNIKDGIFSKHKHTLMMVSGCIIPVLFLGILWVEGVSQKILSFGILVALPSNASCHDEKCEIWYAKP
ncbi:MAG: hypothetical protein L6282_11850 [Candidatus Methanoperedenaceae archaeon]|nr:hypothetical protein [Candidatus Methanoperedenaceae archaeon]